MKIIAITPDDFKFQDLLDSFRSLKELGASHIYLRSPFVLETKNLKNVVSECFEKDFVPILPFSSWKKLKIEGTICHFKEKEISFFNDFISNYKTIPFSVSCHNVDFAEQFLEKGADFVFFSPVFIPFSKKDYSVNPLVFSDVKYLVEKFGEKVVLLGGIDFSKVKELKLLLGRDFSFAGITMFFGKENI